MVAKGMAWGGKKLGHGSDVSVVYYRGIGHLRWCDALKERDRGKIRRNASK